MRPRDALRRPETPEDGSRLREDETGTRWGFLGVLMLGAVVWWFAVYGVVRFFVWKCP